MANIFLYLAYFSVGSSTLAAVFALLAFLAARRPNGDGGDLSGQIAPLIRAEFDRIRSDGAEQGRGIRQELADNLRGFQTATLQAFTELGRQLGEQVHEIGGQLDAGIRVIEARAAAISTELDQELDRMSEQAIRGREALEQTIAGRLDDSAAKGTTAARELREEVSRTVGTLQDSLVMHLSTLRGNTAQQAQLLRTEVTNSLKQSSDAMITSLGHISETQGEQLGALRTEITENVHRLANSLSETLTQLGVHQKDRLEELTRALASLTEGQLKAQEALRATMESRLDAIRAENANKLDEMRRTVDEKLQSTLEKRLNDSFRIVSEQLERVYQGLGEMQSLAAGVGDLKRVLSNVKVRGTRGEIQLGNLLEQFLAPEQYLREAQVRDDSLERVEFAIRLPGRDGEHEVLIPIDAKFPHEDFERLVVAAENADAAGVEEAGAALELRIKGCARLINEKYINPPRTTDIAILFLPTEGLYAEVLHRPGLFEHLQREYHVTIAGPTTLAAILNALQMGFRSLAIQERSSEVWQMLGAIRTEFGKYSEVVDRLRKQLNAAVNTVDTLGVRARAVKRRLREVETLPDGVAQSLLGIDPAAANDIDGQEEEIGATE